MRPMAESGMHKQTRLEQERRGGDRQPLMGEVVVSFEDSPLIGSGQNASPEGVFFVAEGAVRVQVQLEGREPVVGEVVRMTSMGNGKIGIAVAFPDPGS
jgi:hypothetical protein